MLEHVPAWLGKTLTGVRAGMEKLAVVRLAEGEQVATLQLSSPALADGARMPERFTADGQGVSPPLCGVIRPPVPRGWCCWSRTPTRRHRNRWSMLLHGG